MGGNSSSNGPIFESTGEIDVEPAARVGAENRFMPQTDELEIRMQQAYTKGKEEGEASFHGALELAAMQVLDNVQEQLENIEKEKSAEAKEKLKKLEEKLKVINGSNPCISEEQSLIDCLSAPDATMLSCEHIVQKYARCAKSI